MQMKNIRNHMRLSLPGLAQNEAFARAVVAAFAAQCNPTIEELSDVKTAVSEAVTNAIVHGYEGRVQDLTLEAFILEDGQTLVVEVADTGRGITDVEQARQPFFTTAEGDERSGMGFTMMETFMDELVVTSAPGKGTTVTMTKRFNQGETAGDEE